MEVCVKCGKEAGTLRSSDKFGPDWEDARLCPDCFYPALKAAGGKTPQELNEEYRKAEWEKGMAKRRKAQGR